MSIYRQFETLVSQRRNPYINQPQLPPDVLPIQFKFYKLLALGRSLINDGIDLVSVIFMQPTLVAQETINVDRTTLLSDSTRALVGDVLSYMLVPEHEHPAITEEVFHELAGLSNSNSSGNANNTTMLPVVVDIVDMNLMMPTVGSDPITLLVDRVAMSSMQTYEARPIPADEIVH